MSFKSILATLVVSLAAVNSAQAFSGDATYYIPNGGFGACGQPIQNTDFAVALNPTQYASGANCGRNINVQYQGKSVTATVRDLCPGCSSGDVDLTPTAFEKLAPTPIGRIQVTWNFV